MASRKRSSKGLPHPSMGTAKVAITLETGTLAELDRSVKVGKFPSVSRAVQTAVHEMIARRKRGRLVEDLAKLNAYEERELVEEVFRGELPRPEY
jgi:Arc/MetJ-type ribon-helix-helix transcriptional regulator